MWRHCHCGYDFGVPSGRFAGSNHREEAGADAPFHDGAIIIDPRAPEELQASIRFRLMVTWLIVGTLLWLGWIFGDPLRIHWYNISVGTLGWILPRLRCNVPRYRGVTTSVRLRIGVALIAVMLLACCFVLPMDAQPYILSVLIVPGAIAAIYSEARLFWNPLQYFPSSPPAGGRSTHDVIASRFQGSESKTV